MDGYIGYVWRWKYMDSYKKVEKIDNFFNNLTIDEFDKILIDAGIDEIKTTSNLKCIGKTCRYYQDHDFCESYFICSLIGTSHTKVDIRDCLIKDMIQDIKDNLIAIEEYSKVIEENQI